MISIVIPTYNRSGLLRRTIDSIIAQTFSDWECLIVDDHSTDDTEQIANEIASCEGRVRYLRNSRKKGAQGARNTGIIESKGEWIVLFDSDNLMNPSFLEQAHSYLQKNNIDVVGCWSRIIDSTQGKEIGTFHWVGEGNIHSELMTGKCYYDNSSTVIRKTKLIEIGLLDEQCPAFQEWDTHIRISNNAAYGTVKQYLVDYYSGRSDSISSNPKKDIKGYLFILSKFKKEWESSYRMAFYKYVAILFNRLRSFPDYKTMDEYREYKCLEQGLNRPVLLCFSVLLRIKQTINK